MEWSWRAQVAIVSLVSPSSVVHARRVTVIERGLAELRMTIADAEALAAYRSRFGSFFDSDSGMERARLEVDLRPSRPIRDIRRVLGRIREKSSRVTGSGRGHALHARRSRERKS